MADGSVRTPGSGETIASDDIGGVKWQRMKIAVGADGAAVDVQPPDADGKAGSSILPAGGQVWNGASWDRERGNLEGTLLASAARTAGAVSATQTNHNSRGVQIALLVSAKAAATTLDFYLYGVDPITGGLNYFAKRAAFAAAVNTGLLFVVYPGLLKADMVAAGSITVVDGCSAPLPRRWALQIAPSDANSVTYSVSYSLIV